MIVSDRLTYSDVMSVIPLIESKLDRHVNATLYKSSELRKRADTDNSFVKRVMEQPKILLIGMEDEILKP